MASIPGDGTSKNRSSANLSACLSSVSEATVETESAPRAFEIPARLGGESLLSFLEPYGYIARDECQWLPGCATPEISLSVTGHSKASGSTHYDVECSLAVRGHWHSPYLAWHAKRRLAHLREGLHDPVKQMFGQSEYKTHFHGAPFAHGYAVPGTTARLNAWCRRLANVVNASLVPPSLVAAVLRVLGVPPMNSEALMTQAQCQASRSVGLSPAARAIAEVGRSQTDPGRPGSAVEHEENCTSSAPPVFRGRAADDSNPFSEHAVDLNPFSHDAASADQGFNPFSADLDFQSTYTSDTNPFSAE